MPLTFLSIDSKAILPGKPGIRLRKKGFRVNVGMTIIEKGLMEHYTREIGGDLYYSFFGYYYF